MSLPAPAAPPESQPLPPLSPPAPSPENDNVSPPPLQVTPIPPPSSPPESSSISPSPLGAPPLPTYTTLPPPTPSLAPPQPQWPPQQPPPLTPPPSVTKNSPPPKKPSPPNISPEPINVTPPTSSSSSTNHPAVTPSPKPSPPPPPPPEQPSRPRTRPGTEPGPSRPKITPSTAPPPRPHSSLPTSAVLPSPPPQAVALPVPQSPGGGAWLPFTPSDPPEPLPSLPSGSGIISSPAATSATSPLADHQNIEAAAAAAESSNGSSGFVVGLCVGGVLLVLLGVVFAILVVLCRRRRRKKLGDYGSTRKQGPLFSGFEDKTSPTQYSKQGSNQPGLKVIVNAASPQVPNMTTNGPGPGPGPGAGASMANASSTLGGGLALSSGTFTYEELAAATNGFSGLNLLGQGGFGYVHKGVLPNGKEVAVKQLKMGGHQGEREFRAEVETISQVHHKHLVSLVGYCIAGPERLLVYEFVPNNTLEFHLHGERQPVMDWPTRLKIAIGSAKGLAYLHEDCSPTVIHRDIKAANILLDFNFEAKVSDFGLAKIFSSTNSSVTHMTTRVVGTFGYLAPEYASSGKVTDKSDVYSYGVMLLELITGRPPISNFQSGTNGSLVNWARPLLTQAIRDGNFDTLVDPQLHNNYDFDEMASMVACAAACVRLSAFRRPRLSQVVRALEGNLSPSELDDGIRPGHSSMHFPYESLDFDAHNYMEDLKRMALTSYNGYTTSRYSENSSEYGLQPSPSSTGTSHLSDQRG